ncbi:16S rRNA (guanine(527)-N(7))-methyltransferase RsmG [Mycoplasmatota bacterium WC30]
MFNVRENLDKDLNKLLNNPKFKIYYEYLIEVNKITNLTRITDEDAVYYKHFYDSIILSKHIDIKNKKFLDVGAGAGFPSIPLKIIEDSLKVTIVDSLNKRINFLNDLMIKLDLNNVTLIHSRVEELQNKEVYDIVTARAVAKLNILSEITIPYVKVGGYLVAFKSVKYQEELNAALPGIAKLGGRLEKVIEYQINDDEKRVLILIKKIKKSDPIYPRHFGKIKKAPL